MPLSPNVRTLRASLVLTFQAFLLSRLTSLPISLDVWPARQARNAASTCSRSSALLNLRRGRNPPIADQAQVPSASAALPTRQAYWSVAGQSSPPRSNPRRGRPRLATPAEWFRTPRPVGFLCNATS